MREILTVALLLIGTMFMLVGAIGILRMPDLLSRMQATTKSMTLGAVGLLLAVALHFDQVGVTFRTVLVIAFYFLTAPIAAHMIGRAAYFTGVPLWSGTLFDELSGKYDPSAHTLDSFEPVSSDDSSAAADTPETP